MSGAQMTSAPVLDGPLPAIMCIGDSLTEFASQPNGWASHLQNHYVSRRDVLLRGMSGYNSTWLRKCLKQILPPHGPQQLANQNIAVITLLFGTNDAVNPNAKSGPGWPQQHVPVEDYEDNMREIVDRLVDFRNTDDTSPIVLVISPPPQDGEDWHNFMMKMLGGDDGGNSNDGSKGTEQKTDTSMPKQRSCEAVRPYAEAARRVVNDTDARLGKTFCNEDNSPSNRIVFIDLYNDMLDDTEGWRRFLCEDGVHFSQDGNKFLFGRISEALKGIEGSPDDLPRHAPHFFDVDSAFGK